MPPFPPRPEAWTLQRLQPPRPNPRVLLDTDAANEIDDQFAIAWALLSPAQIRLEGVHAAPFSFEYRRAEMLRARRARDDPRSASAEDHGLLRVHGAALAHFERQGWDPATVDLHGLRSPAQGMEQSFAEILRLFALLGRPSEGIVQRGAPGYLPGPDRPAPSAAADRLIELAHRGADDDPLYVLAIGCLTNVASALLIDPAIAERIVVVWTAGFPSYAPFVNHAFNLEQDRFAVEVVFGSGVPLVYLPGYHVGAQLRLSLPEAERHVSGRGALGDYLHELFTNNPLWPLAGLDASRSLSWVIWDLINLAWVIVPDWVPTAVHRTPMLGADLRWHAAPARAPMREAYAIDRDAIFRDLFGKLDALKRG
jgi:inosine-uridine nucleoside N-ribohydrolase